MVKMKKNLLIASVIGLLVISIASVSALTGSGTANYIAKFTPNGTNIGDSGISDDGTTVRIVGRDINLEGTSSQKALRFKRTDVASSPHARIEFLDYNNVQYWNFGTNIAVGPGFEINEGTGAGTNRLNIAPGGNVGIGTGTSTPGAKLHIKADTTDSWLTLQNSSGTTWKFDYMSNPSLGINSALRIGSSGAGSPLKLYLPDESGGMRMYLWEEGRAVPNLPHTGIKPTFAVWGDLLIGDIVSIEKNPIQAFMRVESGLSADATTNFYAAKTYSSDTDGGAGIKLRPDDGTSAYSGAVELMAYGRGGTNANSIVFSTRSGVNQAITRIVVDGNGGMTINSLAGSGNDYACLDSAGKLYRSNSAC